ncbi:MULTISPECIES: ABC transporter permease [Fusobacterium]|jgi:lipoprotein-releasing system permease protein|uniref:Lipoprotein-releasing system transmembrane protein lolE n=2 Tax=Fusobacterium ulcerans TaxID=861 RepID=A0AAX2JDC3_9FUSO|nr:MULTISPECIES: ABC transporter permease [Fusobacterium]AVQ26787.1 ABC transporter permease [Fusobacterium ulcerans]EFS25093.1 LolC/E family lipoprotein releasing system, transmembrane protein [Fusobacterium ulcerans ATCC 49185]EHO83566.1 LolC/E family lipoprotein releasing system, transmembrane protein [Fusobacterium ulcerans 12-1B]MCB8564892.1 ABC transporter permease [Fusobacterium ulcerans]MCB8648820.1 ABC transporter permease [Fusobacterium ulcerans]
MVEFFIAKKHIFERKRQSLISTLGIAIGVVVLIVSIGIANGLDKNMINSILSMTSHVLVENGDKLSNYNELKEKIEKIPGVKGAVPSIETQGIFKYNGIYGGYISGVKIEGFDLESAKKAMDLDKKIVEGSISPDKINGVLIGKELFRNIGASLGDEVTIISSENKEIKFKIEGVFQSGYYDYDINMIILPLKAAQYLVYSGDTVNKIDVTLNDPYKAPEIADKIMSETKIFSRTWGDLNRNLLSALSLEKTVMIMVFSLIVIIAGFVVWVTLNMLVREKIKDIGIMRSMGFSRKSIMKIFLIQGMLLGIAGIVIGTIISLCFLWYIKNYTLAFITSIYYLTKIPVEISVKEIGVIIGANIGIIFVSSVFPAYRAAKMETVEALRHE